MKFYQRICILFRYEVFNNLLSSLFFLHPAPPTAECVDDQEGSQARLWATFPFHVPLFHPSSLWRRRGQPWQRGGEGGTQSENHAKQRWQPQPNVPSMMLADCRCLLRRRRSVREPRGNTHTHTHSGGTEWDGWEAVQRRLHIDKQHRLQDAGRNYLN